MSEPSPRELLYALVAAGFLLVVGILVIGAAATGLVPAWWTMATGAGVVLVVIWSTLNWRKTVVVLTTAIGLFVSWAIGDVDPGRVTGLHNLIPVARGTGRLASPFVTSEVSVSESSATETIKRFGPSLVVASAVASTLGIVIAQFIDDLGDGILAEVLGGNAVLHNNRVVLTGVSDLAWAGGFLLCLIVGFLALFSYPTARGHGVARLILLWMVLHLLRQAFFQAALLPLDPGSDLALAYATLEVPAGLDIVVAAGGAVGLLLVALSAAAAFLAFTPHHKLISTGRKRLTFAFWIALVPAVASMFLAIPFFVPDAGSGVIPALPLTAVIFLATVAAAPGTTTVLGPEDHRETPWPWGLGATLMVILIFEQVVMRGGISVDPSRWG